MDSPVTARISRLHRATGTHLAAFLHRWSRAAAAVALATSVVVVASAWTANPGSLAVATFGGAEADYAVGVRVDPSGNIVTAGRFSGTVDLDPGTGSSMVTAAGYPAGGNYADGYVSKLDASGNLLWAHQLSGALMSNGDGVDDYASSLATDSSGNVYVAGSFWDEIDVDSGPGSTLLTAARQDGGEPSTDFFVVKYGPSGNVVWAGAIGGPYEDDYPIQLAVDPAGNVLLTGSFLGSIDADPGTGEYQLPLSIDENDPTHAFVIKLDADGDFDWAGTFGGLDGDEPHAIATDASGNFLVAGVFYGTVDFDLDVDGLLDLTTSDPSDMFLASYDPAGAVRWAKRFEGSGSGDRTFALATDGSGAVYATGRFSGTLDLDPSDAATSAVSSSGTDGFAVKLNAAGAFQWGSSLGNGTGTGNVGTAIAVDSAGSAYVAGTYEVDATFGSTTLTNNGQTDVVVVQLNSSGATTWARGIGGASYDAPVGIALNSAGEVLVAGTFNGTVDFDPSSATSAIASNGGSDVFISKLTASGATVSATTTATPTTTTTTTVAPGPLTDAYVNAASGNDSWSCAVAAPSPSSSPTDGPCKTIQAAIDKAVAGADINVSAGTYAENLTIGKQLVLLCANAGVSAGSAPGTRGAESIIRGEANVTVANVAFDGCTFARPDVNATSAAPRLIETIGVTGGTLVENSILDLTVFNTASDRGCGAALFGTTRWEANNNEFRNQRYTGCASGVLYNSRTIMAEDGQGVVADGNFFNGAAQSIYVTGSINQNPGTLITNNRFASNSAGPFLGRPRDVIIRGNTFEGGGIYLDSSTDTVIENNRFTGASYAIYAAGTHTGVVFRNNAVLGKYASSAGSPWAGRTMFNTGANPINAANNWWGQAGGPDVTTPPTPDLFYQNPGLMPYRPWIAGHVDDTNPTAPYTTGFWPTSTITGNRLTGIVPSTSGALTPSFAPETPSYTLDAGQASTITVTPSIVAGSGTTVTVNGTSVTPGSPSPLIPLTVGTNTITIIATDGSTTTTYTITTTRAPAPSTTTTTTTVAPAPAPAPAPTTTAAPTTTVAPTTTAAPPTTASVTPTTFNAGAIRPTDVANIAPSQLRTIQPAQVNRLAPEAVAALNPTQVAAIPPSALTGLRPTQVSAMPVEAVAALRPAQLSAIPPRTIAALQPDQIAAIPPAAVAALRPTQVASIPPSAISAIPVEAVSAMRPTQVAAIPPRAMAALQPAQVAALPTQAVAALSPAQVTALPPTAVASLQPQQLAAIPVAAIDAMRPAQVAAIPPAAFAAMTPQQVGTFSAAQARSVTPEQAAVLTPRQLRSLPASVRRILQNLAAEANENG